MSEPVQLQEKPMALCPGCNVEVREGSEYCFNCGGKLDQTTEKNDESPRLDNGFRAVAPGALSKGRGRRRRPKPLLNEPVHVRWQHDEDAGIGFLVLSLVLGLIAAVLVALGFYLR
jgi:hypothetical protein